MEIFITPYVFFSIIRERLQSGKKLRMKIENNGEIEN